ncbi:MAG: hypothetical protein V7K48_15605 [Nostoc sp.]|uniref:hypothetical protein n=1 Tax=Nostoc sp. TaxID=1180 RepID=UPI002FFCE120
MNVALELGKLCSNDSVCAQHFDVGNQKQIVLALDQAGWHTAKKLEIPQGIHIIEMPSHFPELQPAERLWPLTNEPIAFPFI